MNLLHYLAFGTLAVSLAASPAFADFEYTSAETHCSNATTLNDDFGEAVYCPQAAEDYLDFASTHTTGHDILVTLAACAMTDAAFGVRKLDREKAEDHLEAALDVLKSAYDQKSQSIIDQRKRIKAILSLVRQGQ